MPVVTRKDAADHFKMLRRAREKHDYKEINIINKLMKH